MKILLISSNSIHLHNYYQLIKDKVDSIDIITDSRNPKFDYGQSRIHYINFSLKKHFHFKTEIKTVKKIIEEQKIDLVHAHQAVTHAYIAAKALRKSQIPLVVTIWGSDVLLNPKKSILHRLMNRYILRHADHLTMDAQFIKTHVEKIAKKNLNCTFITYGVDVPDENILHKKEKIFYSNRLLEPLYNIENIILSFDKLVQNQDFSDYKLLIAGLGSEERRLKKLVESKGLSKKIIFLGWLNKEENFAHYSKARFFVSVPKSDGTSVSLLEAMAHGCIPIVSDLPANREWVNDKENGLIVQPSSLHFLNDCHIFDFDKTVKINNNIIRNRAGKEHAAATFLQLYKTVKR